MIQDRIQEEFYLTFNQKLNIVFPVHYTQKEKGGYWLWYALRFRKGRR